MLLNVGHWFFKVSVNIALGLKLDDPFTMYKVFRRDCIAGLTFESNRFDFDYELLFKIVRKGYRPIEIPVNYRSRTFSEGKKVSMTRDPWTWLRAILRFRRVDLNVLEGWRASLTPKTHERYSVRAAATSHKHSCLSLSRRQCTALPGVLGITHCDVVEFAKSDAGQPIDAVKRHRILVCQAYNAVAPQRQLHSPPFRDGERPPYGRRRHRKNHYVVIVHPPDVPDQFRKSNARARRQQNRPQLRLGGLAQFQERLTEVVNMARQQSLSSVTDYRNNREPRRHRLDRSRQTPRSRAYDKTGPHDDGSGGQEPPLGFQFGPTVEGSAAGESRHG
jgi:hypothetical protein